MQLGSGLRSLPVCNSLSAGLVLSFLLWHGTGSQSHPLGTTGSKKVLGGSPAYLQPPPSETQTYSSHKASWIFIPNPGRHHLCRKLRHNVQQQHRGTTLSWNDTSWLSGTNSLVTEIKECWRGWRNQTEKRAAEEFLPWFDFIKSFSLLSSMPMGRQRGQSLADSWEMDTKILLQWGLLSNPSLKVLTTQEPRWVHCVWESHALWVSDNAAAARSSTALPHLTLIWTQNVLFQTSAAQGRAHTQPCPHWEASCQRGELPLLQLSLTENAFFSLRRRKVNIFPS